MRQLLPPSDQYTFSMFWLTATASAYWLVRDVASKVSKFRTIRPVNVAAKSPVAVGTAIILIVCNWRAQNFMAWKFQVNKYSPGGIVTGGSVSSSSPQHTETLLAPTLVSNLTRTTTRPRIPSSLPSEDWPHVLQLNPKLLKPFDRVILSMIQLTSQLHLELLWM